MRTSSKFYLTLFLTIATAVAQTAAADPSMSQIMLAEIRQLRMDLQNTAATVQRVQILMFRLEAASTMLQRAAERREQTHMRCQFAQERDKTTAKDIESAEVRKRDSQNPSDRRDAEEVLSRLKSAAETWAAQSQRCQAEQIDTEAQLHTEEAKMNELQNQLEQFDQILAGKGGK